MSIGAGGWRGFVAAALAAGLALVPNLAPADPVEAVEVATASTALPLARGLPVEVLASANYLAIEDIDENAGSYRARVDLRLQWQDDRLAYDASRAPRGALTWRGEAAAGKLAEIWAPDIGIANQVGEPLQHEQGLRLFPDGRVEWMQRISADFSNVFDGSAYPFDRQTLALEIVCRNEPLDEVRLAYGQAELDESQLGQPRIRGWQVGVIDLALAPLPGWYRQPHSRLVASLELRREPATQLAVLYLPLFASLLIPLLALWLCRCEDGVFQVDAMDVANILIGGLFAVVALNFTFNSEHPWLAGGGNSASLLFELNYLTLAVCLAVNIGLFRFELARRLAGSAFQQELHDCLMWAIPLLVLIASCAVLGAAMA